MSAKTPAFVLKAQQYWAERNPRERLMLQIWLSAVLLAALYFGVYSPLTTQIKRLELTVPKLETQLMAMRGSKSDVATLKPNQGQQDLRTATFTALSAKKISADVRSLTPTQVELHASLPNVNEALQLASALRGETAAKISAIQIKTEAQGVALVMVLERT